MYGIRHTTQIMCGAVINEIFPALLTCARTLLVNSVKSVVYVEHAWVNEGSLTLPSPAPSERKVSSSSLRTSSTVACPLSTAGCLEATNLASPDRCDNKFGEVFGDEFEMLGSQTE